MAQSWHSDVLDGSLIVLKDADRVTVCAGAPASYAQATTVPATGKMLAQMAIDAEDFTLAAGAVDGRKITLASQTDTSADASGTADHWALVDDAGDGTLLAVGPLTGSQVVTAANVVVLGAVVITNRNLTLVE